MRKKFVYFVLVPLLALSLVLYFFLAGWIESSLESAGEDLGLQFKQTLSGLQDVDYNKAVSDLTQQQISLQAAQKSFLKISELSLFNYI